MTPKTIDPVSPIHAFLYCIKLRKSRTSSLLAPTVRCAHIRVRQVQITHGQARVASLNIKSRAHMHVPTTPAKHDALTLPAAATKPCGERAGRVDSTSAANNCNQLVPRASESVLAPRSAVEGHIAAVELPKTKTSRIAAGWSLGATIWYQTTAARAKGRHLQLQLQ